MDFIEPTRDVLPSPQIGGENRVKSALRLKYEAEVGLIQRKYGGLEGIRNLLGLSQRKICQLLLVDPSAWNRWTQSKGENAAPPHIFRALEWYLYLQEKNPSLDQRFWLSQIANSTAPSGEIERLQGEVARLSAKIHALEEQSRARSSWVWPQLIARFFRRS